MLCYFNCYFNCGFKRKKLLQSKQMVSICSDTVELLINVENTEETVTRISVAE